MKRKMFFAAVNSILILAVMLSFVQLALAVSTADAKEKPELKNDCLLTLHYTHGENEFAGLDVVLYHVADLTNDVRYALSGSFAACPVSVSGVTSQSEWNEIAVTLNSFIVSEKIAPIKRTLTDENGTAVFEGLTAGLYLLNELRAEQGDAVYIFGSFLVSVPGIDENGKWVYDVTAKPKSVTVNPSGDEITYRVVKVWKGGGDKRPESVTAGIYKNGVLIRNVVLNASAGWMYSWKAIDDGSVWSVAEAEIPEGYTVRMQKNGTTFDIINACSGGDNTPTTGDTDSVYPYLIVMAASGILLIFIGAVRRKKRDAE